MRAALSADRRFYFGDRLTFLDIIVYSYLSVLLNIPTSLTPWGCFYSDELSSATNLGSSMGGLTEMRHGNGSFSEGVRVHPIKSRRDEGSESKTQLSQNCKSSVSTDLGSVPQTRSSSVKIGLKRLAQFLCDVDSELWEISTRHQFGSSCTPKPVELSND
eukprot:GHVS01048276.1.p1 GENE.GHVS01048276.1~~GHVS01048276.1.p1  ORF type:complete len:160 (+),score=8.29 GHVS01048276.1:201-680(+)